MKPSLIRFSVIALTTLFLALPAGAEEKGDITVNLTSQKVVKAADGKETLVGAETAKPGEIIQYKAVYQNAGKSKASDILATIPVPLGTEYIPGSAAPAQVTASVDGKEYAPVPLKRKVKLSSGKEEVQAVPYEEYRFIRWDIKTLAPGKSTTVRMRVKVSTATVPSTK